MSSLSHSRHWHQAARTISACARKRTRPRDSALLALRIIPLSHDRNVLFQLHNVATFYVRMGSPVSTPPEAVLVMLTRRAERRLPCSASQSKLHGTVAKA